MEERSSEEHDDHDITKPQILVDQPEDVNTYKKRPTWAQEIIQEVKKYDASEGTSIEIKRTHRYSIYMALL